MRSPITLWRLAGLDWRWVLLGSFAASLAVLESRQPWAVAVLLVILAACLAMWLRQGSESISSPLSPRLLVHATLFVYSALFLLVPATIGAIGGAARTAIQLSQDFGHTWGDGGALLFALLGVIFVTLRWPQSWGNLRFLAVVATLFLAVKLLYVHFVQTPAVSDFAGMWAQADAVANRGLAAAADSDFFAVKIHLQRALPYLIPLRLLFGPESSSYAISNAFVTVITGLMTYLLTRQWYGPRAARCAFVITQLAPEPLWAAEIPSHDIPAALFTLVTLVLFILLHRALVSRKHLGALVLSGVIGLALLVVDLQRSTGLVVLVSCGGVTLLALTLARDTHLSREPSSSRVRRVRWLLRPVLVLVIPLLIYSSSKSLLESHGLTLGQELAQPQAMTSIAAATDSWGDGSHRYFQQEWVPYYFHSPIPWRDFLTRKILTDIYHTPTSNLSLFVRKAQRLYELGSQLEFYLDRATLAGREVGSLAVYRARSANALFTMLFLAAFVAGGALAWKDDRRLMPMMPMIYLATLSGALLLIGEVQPRYMFQIWFIGPIYIGHLLREKATITNPE